MEYEIVDEPRDEEREPEDEGDSALVRDHSALKNQSSVHPEDYPPEDRAMFIPEEEAKD